MAWKIVIAGGGFGGFYAARALERLLPSNSAEVTLVNEANFMLYTPLLPGAAELADTVRGFRPFDGERIARVIQCVV